MSDVALTSRFAAAVGAGAGESTVEVLAVLLGVLIAWIEAVVLSFGGDEVLAFVDVWGVLVVGWLLDELLLLVGVEMLLIGGT